MSLGNRFDEGQWPGGDRVRGRVYARFRRALNNEIRISRSVRRAFWWLCLILASVATGLVIPMRRPQCHVPQNDEMEILGHLHDQRARAFAGWLSASSIEQDQPR